MNGPKTKFWSLFFIMKTYIICCVHAQIPYSRKCLFLRYGPKCFQPVRLQDKSPEHLQNKSVKQPRLLHVVTNPHRIKVDQIIFEWAWSKTDNGSLVMGLRNWLYLKNFAWWCKFRKAKSYFYDFRISVVKVGCGHLVHMILKSFVS